MLTESQKRLLIVSLKLLVAVVVAAFIVRAVLHARGQFSQQEFSLDNVRPHWLVLASAFYLLGVFPMALFWHRLLHALGQRPVWGHTVRAHYIGHLGKYVPGKAMVLALRLGMIGGAGVDVTVGALSVLAETLTMMSVGALVAASILAIEFRQRTDLLVVALAAIALAGIPASPPVLRRVLRWIGRARQSRVNGQFTSRVTWRVLLPGWVAVALGWVLLGLSFWATLRAIDLPSTRDIPLRELPHLTATLALAVVAGFVSLLPAGVGVREMILNEMMVRQFGEVAAIVAPLTLRIVWLVSELCISSILYFAFPRSTAGRESKECAPEPTTRTDVD